MIQNNEAREIVATRIMGAPNGKRRGHGAAFRTDRAAWLARGEKAVGVVGGRANMAIYSPAGARSDCSRDRILFFGADAVLVHEEIADEASMGWFTAAYARAA